MRCGIALGSNIADRLAYLREACTAVSRLNTGFAPLLISPVYESEPMDCEPGSAPFLNAVMEIEYDGVPAELLAALQQIENALGRPSRHPRNASRTIDLDILYAGELSFANDGIVIPHPRLHFRRFVLRPLADIRPDLILPGFDRAIPMLLASLPSSPGVTRVSSAWADLSVTLR